MEVAAIYHHVIRQVIKGARADFCAEQVPEAMLKRLTTLWEEKLLGNASGCEESTGFHAEGDSVTTYPTRKRDAQHLEEFSNTLPSKVSRHASESDPEVPCASLPGPGTVGTAGDLKVPVQDKVADSRVEDDCGEILSSDSDEDGDGKCL